MLNMTYVSENNEYRFEINLPNVDELSLSQLIAHFANLTKWMGYHEGSWERTSKEVAELLDNEYSMWDWANDILCDPEG